MKKAIFALVMLVAFGGAAMAQQAIGLRAGYGTELTYQKDMGANRLELDLGNLNTLSNDTWSYLSVVGMYQWKFNISGGFGWFAGIGGGLGMYMSDFSDYNGLSLGVGAQAGLEFKFPGIPLQVSLDARPMFNIIHPKYYDGLGWTGGFGIRYCF